MSAATVHQTLHGYRRGHEILAGSVRLPASASDLVTRLSDLSGSTVSGWKFASYITGYPLVGANYFAIARTWEDTTAARAGCVLTHTLLVPIDAWRTASDPRDFAVLFADEKDLRDVERFMKPLHFEPTQSMPPHSVSLTQGATVDFVRKYYGEGQRPLIWIDCSEPEDTAWAIIRVLWPALRERFAWCTASLQPRSVDMKPLDLQFVPADAYSRFHKIQRENFVEDGKLGPPAEPWCLPCAQWIFSGSQSGPIDAEIRAFGPYLRDDPTLMRHLFLAKDLSDRVNSSPTAGAGLLDVTEALAPKPDEAIDYKSNAARKAMDSAAAASPDEALKCLFLVGDRLTKEPFRGIADELRMELATSVEKLASRHTREALVMPERVVSRGDVASTPYFRGVIRGLSRSTKESPSDLICLQDFNKTSPHIIAASPPIAGGYLRGLRATGEKTSGRDALVGWMAGLNDPTTRHALRQEVLPEVRDDLDAVLVEQLCWDMPAEDIGDSLDALSDGTAGFDAEKVLATLQELVAIPYPETVRAWAVQQKNWPRGVVSLVSATFPADTSGFSQVVTFGPADGKRRAALLTAFLGSCTFPRVPGWLKDSARQSADWVAPLLSLGSEMPSETAVVLNRMLPDLRDVPLSSRIELKPVLSSLSRFDFWPSIVDLTLRNAVTAFVVGELDEAACREWFSEDWASRWVGAVSRGELAAALVHPVSSIESRERAFRWLAFAPHSLYERHATLVIGLFWELVSERRFGWTSAMGGAWAKAIRRIQRAAPGSSTLRMCADVLQFGFDHTGDMVGAAVAAAFYPVYRAVCDSNWTPHEVSSLFGLFDWDKAKELRKGIVQAFLGSKWHPGDLALSACEDVQLLRKFVKRTMRQDNGCSYVTAMLNDLVERGDPDIARTVEMVRDLASNPDFHEPWD